MKDYQRPSFADHSMLDSFLKNAQEKDIFTIKEAIEDINSYLVLRQNVNKDILDHADKVKVMIGNFILKHGGDESNTREIVEFQKKLIEIEEIKIQEKLNFFRDTADLKRELREIMQELRQKESKGSILDGFLTK